jgi:histidinol dehydrogenase
MPLFLSTQDPDFELRFQALLGLKREEAEDVDQAVAAIIADVRARGDAAVRRRLLSLAAPVRSRPRTHR